MVVLRPADSVEVAVVLRLVGSKVVVVVAVVLRPVGSVEVEVEVILRPVGSVRPTLQSEQVTIFHPSLS
jgi:hypothetical protein